MRVRTRFYQFGRKNFLHLIEYCFPRYATIGHDALGFAAHLGIGRPDCVGNPGMFGTVNLGCCCQRLRHQDCAATDQHHRNRIATAFHLVDAFIDDGMNFLDRSVDDVQVQVRHLARVANICGPGGDNDVSGRQRVAAKYQAVRDQSITD